MRFDSPIGTRRILPADNSPKKPFPPNKGIPGIENLRMETIRIETVSFNLI